LLNPNYLTFTGIMRYFLQLSYNGNAYHGWQIQPNAVSVQEIMNERLSLLLKTNIMLTGCGRTDTGVHAREFFAHFDFPETWSQQECTQLGYKLDKFLPYDIAVYKVFQVKDAAHARFSAASRTYNYLISLQKDPFMDLFAYHFSIPLDLEAMNHCAKILLEYKDFACFSKVDNDSMTTDCILKEISWTQHNNQLIFSIKANRFLRNMVRAIVGTLMDIGRGRYGEEKLREILGSGNRRQAGESVPAHGLYLQKVEYPESIFMAPHRLDP